MKSTEIFPHRDDIPEGFVPVDLFIPAEVLQKKYTTNQLGHIRSLWGRFGARIDPLPLSVSRLQGRKGWHLSLCDADRKPWFQASVRSVVMLTFGGPRPKGHRVVPIDGNYDNHCFWNLEYVPMDKPVISQYQAMRKERPKRPPTRKFKKMFSDEDWAWVFAEVGKGRKLIDVWEDKYEDRTTIASFLTQFYTERKKRRTNG